MARSVHKLADTDLSQQLVDDLKPEAKVVTGPTAQLTIIPGSAESRQVQLLNFGISF